MADDVGVVFWDFDGTLARREGLWASALEEAWIRCAGDASLTASDLRLHLGRGFPWHSPEKTRPVSSAADWWDSLHPVLVRAYVSAGGDAALAAEAARAVPETFYRVDAWTMIDGAVAALELCRKAGRRNIILSNHAPELPALVEALGLSALVETTITSALVGAEKPNRQIFDHALRVAGDPPLSQVWMVGDNPIADVEGARGAGIRALLADGDYPDSVGMTVLQAAQHIIESCPVLDP